MSIKYVLAHRKDPNNVGDIAANPLQYFLSPDQYQTIDVAHPGQEDYPGDVPVVVGGGGLIGNDFMGNVIANCLLSPDEMQLKQLSEVRWKLISEHNWGAQRNFKNKYSELIEESLTNVVKYSAPKYAWGIGHNGSTASTPEYPEELNQYSAVGLRDWGTHSHSWVPCASCLHPALRKNYTIKNPVIWFEHKKQLIKDRSFGNEPIPRFVNSGANIEQTIELLGSAEVVLTNSYHGAYWATLLQRRVIVVGAWSSKFHHMKHAPVQMPAEHNWRDVLDQTQIYPHALDECADANHAFWKRIK
jgi:hypothetical protein